MDTYFNRFDILLAHLILEYDYNVSGMLQERPSNQRRKMSTGYQIWRMAPGFSNQDVYRLFFASDNAKAIYAELVTRYNLPTFGPGDPEYDGRYEVFACDYS